MAKHKSVHLTARTDIGPYRRGDHIEEEGDVEASLKGEHRHHFIRVAADKEPEPAPKPAEVKPEAARIPAEMKPAAEASPKSR
jgi:hypothetical protein